MLNYNIDARKIKKLPCVMAVILCCIIALTLNASAAVSNKIELKASGSEAKLTLDFPQAAAEEIASMQISLSVSASSSRAEIEFIPDSGLAAKIVESRYHSDTGVLNIYLAGTEALFSASAPLSVGKVKISGSAVSATVEVVEDSVKFVRGSELVDAYGGIDYPASVRITTSSHSNYSGGGTATQTTSQTATEEAEPTEEESSSEEPVPEETAEPYEPPASEEAAAPDEQPAPPEETKAPAQQTTPAVNQIPDEPTDPIVDTSYDRSDIIEPIPQDTTGGNYNPCDTSALMEALSRASGYERAKYTESSFAALTEVVNKAKDLLSDPNVTQDSIDEALLALENAIGMLTLNNNVPPEDESSISSSSAEDITDNGDSDMSQQNAQTTAYSAPESEETDSSALKIIIPIIIVVIIAAIAAVIVIILKKKK